MQPDMKRKKDFQFCAVERNDKNNRKWRSYPHLLMGLLMVSCNHTSALTVSPNRGELKSTTTRAAAEKQAQSDLMKFGFANLPCKVDDNLVLPARDVVQKRLDMLLSAAEDAGCDVEQTAFVFQEICHRQQYRYDISFEADTEDGPISDWQSLIDQAVTKACDCLNFPSHSRVIMSGAVVSRPGAEMQNFHVDGKMGELYTLFIPLVDVEPDSDGTQFWPGSHHDTNALSRALHLLDQHDDDNDDDLEFLNALESPGCSAGSLLIFDYRVVHRGRKNTSRDRPMAYAVIATDSGAWDAHNFSRQSVFDVLPIQIEQMERFDDY